MICSKIIFLLKLNFYLDREKGPYGEYNTAQLLQIIPARILVFR